MGYNSKKLHLKVWRLIGHYGKHRNIPFGVKNYRIEWKLCTLVEDRKFSDIYSGFWKFRKKCDFVVIFPKKVTFLIWGVKNPKMKKSEIISFRPCYSMYYQSFVCISFKTLFLRIFKHSYYLSVQGRMKWRHKTRPIAKNVRPIFLHETTPNWCPERGIQISCRYSKWQSYSGNTGGGGGRIRPPRRWRLAGEPAPCWASGFSTACWGGGGVWTLPPWSRLLVAVEKNERQRSKAREKSFRNHFGHFLAEVKIEVTRGQNSKLFQNGFSTIKSLILKVEQQIW